MPKRIECIISGRVQMVMYRDFAMRHARKLGLTGEVHNEQDGTVSVVAEGEESTLLVYVEELKHGSVFSHVKEVVVSWEETTGKFSDFHIRY